MCKTGGPRCADSPARRSQASLSKRVRSRANKTSEPLATWKESNLVEYNALTFDAYSDKDAQPIEPEKVVAVYQGDDLTEDRKLMAELYARMFGGSASYYEEEDLDDLSSLGLTTQTAPATKPVSRDMTNTPGNKHLLPEDAIIHSPTPSPMFVYGTLRTGNHNHRLLEGRVEQSIIGEVPGAALYTNGGFPYLIADDQATSTGELIYVDQDQLVETMDSLDMLEGTSEDIIDDQNHYNRYLWYVKTKEAEGEESPAEYTQAWVYMPPTDDFDYIIKTYPRIPTGDWTDNPPRTSPYQRY